MSETIAIKVRTEFDEQTIIVPVGLMKKSMLRKFLAFVMTTARRSIRKAPKADPKTGQRFGKGRRAKGVVAVDASAEAGNPPFSHGGTWKNLIQFAVEEDGSGGVAGIIKTTGGRTGNMPELTEHGGDAMFRRAKDKHAKSHRFQPHPVMRPALEKELPKIPKMLENSVKK